MTSQSTYRELAPKHAARKVPVPQGREYQREVAVHIVDNWNQRPTVLGKQKRSSLWSLSRERKSLFDKKCDIPAVPMLPQHS